MEKIHNFDDTIIDLHKQQRRQTYINDIANGKVSGLIKNNSIRQSAEAHYVHVVHQDHKKNII